MTIHVTEAKHVGGYKVEVTFSNGKKGVVDLETFLWGPVFEGLKGVSAFSRLRVDEEMQTIVWPDGTDMPPDIDPNYLYFLTIKNDIESQE